MPVTSTGTVAVTGATGFIGKVFLDSLIQQGWQVRALTRRPRSADNAAIQWVTGDLHNLDALQDLVAGTSAVIHCAGTVRGRSREEFDRINAHGTANLVRACTQLPELPRFLLISSLAARNPDVSWYAASKRLAEDMLADLAGDMPWTVFRPTAVYGPGDRELKPLFQMCRRGYLPMPGYRATRFSLIHVDDIDTAVTRWLQAAGPVPGIFELADDRPGGYDRHALAAIAREVWGKPVKTVSLPPFLVYLVAYLNLGLARVFRYSPMLTPGKVRELLYPDWLCDNTGLKKALPGWQPTINLKDALPSVT